MTTIKQTLLLRPEAFFAQPTPDAKVLNYGCGDRKQSHEIGVDVSANTQADYVIEPGEPLPLPDAGFDMAVSRYVLEHVTDIFPLINEVARVLKPGGAFRFVVPHAFSKDAYDDPTHVRFFTISTPTYFVGAPDIHYARTGFTSCKVWLRVSLVWPRLKIIRFPANLLLGAVGLAFPVFGEQLLKMPFTAGAVYCELRK